MRARARHVVSVLAGLAASGLALATALPQGAAPKVQADAGAPRPGLDWPSFRGIQAMGVSEPSVPLRFDLKSGENVAWKTKVPGLGHSSPAIWGDLLCVTTAVAAAGRGDLRGGLYGDIGSAADDGAHAWKVVCLDKRTGALRWEKAAREGPPRVRRHTKSTHANSTVAMDGGHVVALFGSEGLYAFDHSGRLLWSKDLGVLDSGFFRVPEAQWAFGSSPVIHGQKLLIQADVQKGSFLAAFDVATGRELWRTPRTDVPTWSTPTVHALAGPPQVVVNGWRNMGGYDLETGREVWRLHGRGDIPVPTPVAGHGLVFLTSAHGGAGTFAVKAEVRGDASLAEGATTNQGVAWSSPRDAAYMQTPIVYGDHLYVCRDNGVLTVFDARTGQTAYQQRLGDGSTGFTASPVASGGRVYFTSEDGDVFVLKAGPVYELLSRSSLGETSLATPALSEGRIFFRTRDHVMAMGAR
jgi:outer membrane protein assembly factor BamB